MSARFRTLGPFAALLASLAFPAHAETWNVREAKVALSFSAAHLRTLGLELVGVSGAVAPDPTGETGLQPPVITFAAEHHGLSFRTSGGRVTGFEASDPGRIPARGGFSLKAWDLRTGAALPPALLYDFDVSVDPDADWAVRIRTAGTEGAAPLEVRNARVGLDHRRNAFVISGGDVVISRSWAAAMGRPALAGRVIGAIDVRLSAAKAMQTQPAPAGRAVGLDVELYELYSLQPLGRVNAYPSGVIGLSAATTACNAGDVAVPWELEVANVLLETHPFIGLALFRVDSSGVLEMIGKNWIKHTFFAVDGTDCLVPPDTCQPGGGVTLGVNCADTYGVQFNGSQYYLGPREEVNPFDGSWTALGSYFDATPADGVRSFFGGGLTEVDHRLLVEDSDLLDETATYFYEGVYFAANDVDPTNNIGWEQCSIAWDDSTQVYVFTDATPLDELDTQGPVIGTWGDQQIRQQVAVDDGDIWVAMDATDLGGGQWHYEYAVYNRTSDRGIRSFAVPTGFANVTNVGFHDPDQDPLNDWAVTVATGLVTWQTDDFATDPAANVVAYQTMFNFRFDADAAPVASRVQAGIFKPGVGTQVFVPVDTPSSGATSALSGTAGPVRFALRSADPNPFRSGTDVSFSLDRGRDVRLSVVDVTGRTVRVLVDGALPAGPGLVEWDGRDTNGARVAAGVYFFRLQSAGDARTIKGTLLR